MIDCDMLVFMVLFEKSIQVLYLVLVLIESQFGCDSMFLACCRFHQLYHSSNANCYRYKRASVVSSSYL
jgi:hypothetical protein